MVRVAETFRPGTGVGGTGARDCGAGVVTGAYVCPGAREGRGVGGGVGPTPPTGLLGGARVVGGAAVGGGVCSTTTNRATDKDPLATFAYSMPMFVNQRG